MWWCLLCLLSYQCTSALEPIAVYLTWDEDPCTSMTISWIDTNPHASSIEFTEKETNLPKTISSVQIPFFKSYVIHKTHLRNLLENQEYIFRIADADYNLAFKTMPRDLKTPLVFTVGGDVHFKQKRTWEEVARSIVSNTPQFMILGGDLANTGSKDASKSENCTPLLEFLKSWYVSMRIDSKRLIPLIPIIGNHEVRGGYEQKPDQATAFHKLFISENQTSYRTIRFGKYLSIYALDSGHAHTFNGSQENWLRNEIKNDRLTPHRIVAYHVSAYPCRHEWNNHHIKKVRKILVPILDRMKPNLVFEHHDHAYKRTFPLLKGRKCKEGIVYIGNSSLGEDLQKPIKQAWFLKKTYRGIQYSKVVIESTKRTVFAISPKSGIIDSLEQRITQ